MKEELGEESKHKLNNLMALPHRVLYSWQEHKTDQRLVIVWVCESWPPTLIGVVYDKDVVDDNDNNITLAYNKNLWTFTATQQNHHYLFSGISRGVGRGSGQPRATCFFLFGGLATFSCWWMMIMMMMMAGFAPACKSSSYATECILLLHRIIYLHHCTYFITSSFTLPGFPDPGNCTYFIISSYNLTKYIYCYIITSNTAYFNTLWYKMGSQYVITAIHSTHYLLYY